MPKTSRPLPQVPDIDSAIALVCALPSADRAGRRNDVQTVISSAVGHRELKDGAAFEFENSDDVAHVLLNLVLAERNCCAQFNYSIVFGPRHLPIELHVEAAGALVQPLKEMYLGLATKGE